MTPENFITTWKGNALTERGGAQGHFDDLCDLLGVDKPRDSENYCFERGAKKAGGGDGWADVWKRGCFGWENKKPGRDLNAALKQLTDYALHLDNPPLLVVSDRERIIIHTAFTGYPDEPREIRIDALADSGVRQLLRWVFLDPEKLRPEKSTAAITGEAAGLPTRPVPVPEHRASWKKRTLTNLYNEMPAGLQLRQHRLDLAVARAYGWNDYTPEMEDETILGRLLTLNQTAQKL